MNDKDKAAKANEHTEPEQYLTKKNFMTLGQPMNALGTVCVGNVCRVVPTLPKRVKPDVEQGTGEDE